MAWLVPTSEAYEDQTNRLAVTTLTACCSPWTNPEVFAKCMGAFTDKERMRYTLSGEIIIKCIRLTAVLTDEEKLNKTGSELKVS